LEKKMKFPKGIVEKALVACARYCCICHKFCGTKMELHHIKQRADGGDNTFDNCIPLCLDCHAEVKSYNSHHPKGRKFTPGELIKHRDQWYLKIKNGGDDNPSRSAPVESSAPVKICANKLQKCSHCGFGYSERVVQENISKCNRSLEPHIICGVGQSRSRYDYQGLLQSGPKVVKVIDPNMKHWLSDREFIGVMREFLERRETRKVTFILSTAIPLAAMEKEKKILGRGSIHLKECLISIAKLRKGLSKQGRKKLSVFQHPAAFTLTAFFCDPDDKKRGIVVFNPRWGSDVTWAKRLYCVVRRCDHEELFRVLYDPVQPFEYDGKKVC
jgi:hypothetical protein